MTRRTKEHPDHKADVMDYVEAACRLGVWREKYWEGVEKGVYPGTIFGLTCTVPRPAYQVFLLLGRVPTAAEVVELLRQQEEREIAA